VTAPRETSRGRLVRALGLGGRARVVAVMAEDAAGELIRRHRLTGDAAALAAEALVASALLGAHVKGEERIVVEVSGREPAFTFSGEAGADGRLRAKFQPAALQRPPILRGTLAAVKWDVYRELYRGYAGVEHEGFEGALQAYLTHSQQTRGLVRLAARVERDGACALAAGLLVEWLPTGEAQERAEDEEVEAAMAPLAAADVEALLAGLRGPLAGPAAPLAGEAAAVLEVRPLFYRCRCTVARVEGTLLALGADELADLLNEQGGAEVTCHYCAEVYQVGGERLLALIAQARGARGRSIDA